MEQLTGISTIAQSPPPRYVTYQQAEEGVKQLAAMLHTAFGSDTPSSFTYAAIPRGGSFILAMLSYVLDLPRSLFISPPRPSTPLIVVDDVCLGGRRFRTFLESTAHEQVIFAHLYSHPDVRAAITAQEPRVTACLAAHDLHDLAPDFYPTEEARDAWQGRWRTRMRAHAPDQPYWFGLPEGVAFPWSEPDHPYWNAETHTIEDDWRFTAPDRCLKNWTRLGLPPCLETRRTLRSPDAVAFRIRDDHVALYDRRSDDVYGLDGVAADMWRAVVAYGDVDKAMAFLLDRYQVQESDLRADLHRFIEDLSAGGLLEPVD
jgi:hypothetical protein